MLQRVLNVEDFAPQRHARTGLLRRAGFEVVEAATGTEALRLVAELRPALVLLDVQLPDINGFEVCRRIKTEGPPGTLVMHVSAYSTEPEHRVAGLEAGADGYLVAPAEPAELIAQVKALLRLGRSETQARDRLAELEAVYHSAPIGLCVFDRDCRWIRLNQVIADFNGVPLAAHIGRTPREIVPDLAEQAENVLQRVLTTGQPVSVEGSGTTPARPGVVRFWNVRCVPVTGAGGCVTGVSVAAEEVTERKRMESALREREKDVRARADRDRTMASVASVLSDSVDERDALSRVAATLAASFADWTIVDLVTAEDRISRVAARHRDAARQPLLDVLRAHPPDATTLITELLRSGQTEVFREVSADDIAARMTDAAHTRVAVEVDPRSVVMVPMIARQRVIGIFTCARTSEQPPFSDDDVRFLERLAGRTALGLDNARLFHEAQEANRLKDEFIATLSHELRTPLNAILGWTQLLQSGRLDAAKSAAALATIDRNARAQAELLSDILDLSRIVAGKIRLEKTRCDIAPLLEHVVETMKPAAEEKGVQLEAACEAPDVAVEGDPTRLEQIVWNLMSNALKFTSRGGRVDVTAGVREPGCVEIQVRDTGIGISAELLPHVFDRFRQADGAASRDQSGLGIGLSIVKHLAEVHRGSVTATSAGPGRGATFTVRLPLACATCV